MQAISTPTQTRLKVPLMEIKVKAAMPTARISWNLDTHSTGTARDSTMDLAAGLLLRTLIVNALDSPDMEEEGRAVRCQLMIVERALQNISGSEGYEAESKEPLFIGTANISNQEGSKEA